MAPNRRNDPCVIGESEVAPLKEKMPAWKQLLDVAQEAARPLMNREAAWLWKSSKDKKDKQIEAIRTQPIKLTYKEQIQKINISKEYRH